MDSAYKSHITEDHFREFQRRMDRVAKLADEDIRRCVAEEVYADAA